MLQLPEVSTAYQLDADVTPLPRIKVARTFLANKEYEVTDLAKLENYVLVENILIQKVYTYAIAYVGGAANGEYLYTEAVRDLLTWRAVFEGARWQAGILADDF